jgi:hypothetical protein
MNIVVSGSSGLVGSALVPELSAARHNVKRLVRRAPSGKLAEVRWNPAGGELDTAVVEGCDAVIHLAGESIAAGRWTMAKKARIRDSRVRSTALLAEALARTKKAPKVMVCASAIGYYGSRGDELLTEDSPAGSGFLAGVCREWEAAAAPAFRKGIRVVHLRFGVVLSRRGGALAKMLLPFWLGAGGRIGSGRQYMSWIAIGDAVGAIQYAMENEALRGPVNAVAPNPVTNQEFTLALGRALRRPTLFPMPELAARLLFGEMADALLLSSTRVVPERLKSAGYRFRHPALDAALRHLLEKSA